MYYGLCNEYGSYISDTEGSYNDRDEGYDEDAPRGNIRKFSYFGVWYNFLNLSRNVN